MGSCGTDISFVLRFLILLRFDEVGLSINSYFHFVSELRPLETKKKVSIYASIRMTIGNHQERGFLVKLNPLATDRRLLTADSYY